MIYYVIAGSGQTDCSGETVRWGIGDVFIMPGGVEHGHRAGSTDAVLWLVTNEPFLAFGAHAAAGQGPRTDQSRALSGRRNRRQMDFIYAAEGVDAGRAVMFSSDMQEQDRNILPTLTLAMNSLPPGYTQRGHRHNSVAVALVVSGQACYSTVDGRRKEWSPFATTVTPPTSMHSHTNDGDTRALFLIVQDGGLYHHARAMAFRSTERQRASA